MWLKIYIKPLTSGRWGAAGRTWITEEDVVHWDLWTRDEMVFITDQMDHSRGGGGAGEVVTVTTPLWEACAWDNNMGTDVWTCRCETLQDPVVSSWDLVNEGRNNNQDLSLSVNHGRYGLLLWRDFRERGRGDRLKGTEFLFFGAVWRCLIGCWLGCRQPPKRRLQW